MTSSPHDHPARPRILCISFSPIHADARVLRQLDVLMDLGSVTTVGYGQAPEGVARHIQVPDNAPSLPQTPIGVLRLALHLHHSVELASPGERAVITEALASGTYDLVIANDARALPIAFAVAQDTTPVYADMHEWAPEERSNTFIWRLLVAPYMQHLCDTYLPKVAAATSVSAGLAKLYTEQFGVTTELVRNAADLRDLEPSPVDPGVIRLVHSGTADPERNIMELIEAVETLGTGYRLDLYLLRVPGGHLDAIKKRADEVPQVTVHDPIPPETLPTVLNQYDLGVFLYPLRTLSNRFHLPNKFFDFVQARLGLVFSPAPEIEANFAEHGVGVLTADTTAGALVDTLRALTASDIVELKKASHSAARALSSEPDREVQRALVARLLPAR